MRPLTKYFLGNLLGHQLLDEEGVASLRRAFIFLMTGLASVGLFLPRQFSRKFVVLASLADPEPYRQALLTDGFSMICLLVLLAAFVAALVAPAMYPDETDYVTLTPLPLPRRTIFGAKLLALAVFAGAFIVSALLLFALSFPLFTHQRWAEYGRLLRIGAFVAANAAGSAFAFLAVMAQQGLILVALPRRWIQRASLVTQSAAIGGLIVLTPVVVRVATRVSWVAGQRSDLLLFPPAWFLGMEQWWLGNGDPYFTRLAGAGVVAILALAVVVAGCHGWLFRRAERLIAPPPWTPAGDAVDREPSRPPGRGLRASVGTFIAATLGRTRLPQLVFLMGWAVGMAIAVHGALTSSATELTSDGVRTTVAASVSMPFFLSLLAVFGLRAAMLLPVQLGANWVFRMTDRAAARVDSLNAVELSFVLLAVLPALAVSAPVEIAALGWGRGLAALAIAALASAVLLEVALARWRRVPFTCTWLPGNRPLPFAVLWTVVALWVTSTAARFAAFTLIRAPRAAAGFSIVLAAAAGGMRWYRRRSWAALPLEFEDEPFDRVQKLGLGPF